MGVLNKTQLAVIFGSILLIVLLLLTNTKPSKRAEANQMQAPVSVASVVEKIKSSLSNEQKEQAKLLEENLKSSSDKKQAFDTIIRFFDGLRQPIAAAYYTEKAAEASSTEKNWNTAGIRYYAATQFYDGESKGLLFQKAVECFQKTVELNPENVDAKISLAACYVEGTADPMKGITMLRELEKTDSNNVNLQLNFAFFSERSGQWDKAIARFEKVLKIQPDNIEVYLHLADACVQKGDKQKAIEYLEKYNSLVDDTTIKTEVQNYINQLKKN
jgi:tetratricopeptide (TPR) repeat protein